MFVAVGMKTHSQVTRLINVLKYEKVCEMQISYLPIFTDWSDDKTFQLNLWLFSRMDVRTELRFCILIMASVSLGGCWEAPWFCHGYDCPVYTVVNKYESFEERHYNASRWITIDIASNRVNDVQENFWKLYHFMQRENKEDKEIAMTRPVVVSVNGDVENGDIQVSLSVFISAGIALPEPNDKTIKEIDLPAETVYVWEFGGLASEDDFLQNVQKLKKDLQIAGKMFDGTRFVAAGYDAPWILTNRHNEVWIYAA